MLIHFDKQAEVLTPRGWDCSPRAAAADYALEVHGALVLFSHEMPGLQVTVEGVMPEDEAQRMVKAISRQLSAHTGVDTTVVQTH